MVATSTLDNLSLLMEDPCTRLQELSPFQLKEGRLLGTEDPTPSDFLVPENRYDQVDQV